MGHQCCNKQKVKRGLWSPEEDEKLIRHISTHGHKYSWSSVPKLAGLERCGKSCRLRWINYLRPDLKRGAFSEQEERTIIDIHRIIGNKWAQIAKHLPGRTDNEIKNFWNSCIRKKLISLGFDPNTHNLLPPNQIKNNMNTIKESQNTNFVRNSCQVEHNPNTSSLNSSGFGIVGENCMWATCFEPPLHEEHHELMFEKDSGVEMEMENDIELAYGGDDDQSLYYTAFDSSDFDFGFEENPNTQM